MKTRKWVSILYFPGINCERETAAAFELAGVKTRLIMIADVVSGKVKLTDCDVLCSAGGFSYGDYILEGMIAAIMVRDVIPDFLEAKVPSLWICNGFQIAARLRIFGTNVTLSRNRSGMFVSRPCRHRVQPSSNIWTLGLANRVLAFPSAHGGGCVVHKGPPPPRVIMKYVSFSPNGGPIAAVGSENGLALGIMDHPERPYGNPDGQEIFRNGVAYATAH